MTTLTETTPTSTETPRASRPLYPLTWARGLAAILVLTFHAYQHNRTWPSGSWPWSGTAHQLMLGTDLFVEMFFVLSGLVLWLPIARACVEGRAGRPGWVMLLRRMARLLPLYYAVVLVVWSLTNPSLPGHWQDLLLHLTFTQVYSDQYVFWTAGPAWSLAVEFHFYVLMALSVPVVHALARRASGRAGRVAAVSALPVALVAVGLGYLYWAIQVADISATNWSVWFSPLSRAADFGIGMGLAVVAAVGVRLPRAARVVTTVLGISALLVLVLQRPFTETGEWWHPMYAAAIALALCAIVLHDGPWPAVLEWRPLAWVGSLGYGIYLIHEPVLRRLDSLGVLPGAGPGMRFLLSAALVAVPTVLLAWLSSRTIETAGPKLLATIDGSGNARDYYPHVEDSRA